MNIKYNTRMVVLLAFLIGVTISSMVLIGFGQYVNASTTKTQYPSYSSVSMNLFVEGIDGESIIAGREKSITVLGYSHSISNPYDLFTGDLTSKQHSPLRVMKLIDKSTPKLQEKCVKNAVIPTVTLRFYFEPAGLNFYTIELTNAKVTSFQGFGTISADEIPRETVSFTYESIKWTYTEYDDAGNPKGNVEAEDNWTDQPN